MLAYGGSNPNGELAPILDALCNWGENYLSETQLETHEVIAGNGTCINEGTAITYEPGIISVFPANVPHEVNAGEDGLCLFAKFMPALC